MQTDNAPGTARVEGTENKEGDAATRAPLKVGILLNTLDVPAWVAGIVERIQASSYARVDLVMLNITPRPRRNALRKLASNRRRLVYAMYRLLDTRLASSSGDAFTMVDIRSLLAGVEVVPVLPRRTTYSDYFPDDALQRLRDANLDVVLRFGFRILRGDVLHSAHYGIWSYHHGDNRVNRGGPAGFWEVLEGSAVTGAVLQILSEDLDGGTVIGRMFARTHRWSVHRNRNNYYVKACNLALRALEALYRDGVSHLVPSTDEHRYEPYSRQLYRRPSNTQMTRLLARKSAEFVRDRASRLWQATQWFIAFKKHQGDGPKSTFYQFRPLLPPTDRFWADPFPIARKGRHFVFCEEFVRSTARGHISVFEVGADGSCSVPSPVLERPYHLAYPHVFEWKGAIFMVPDSSKNRSVQLFRCTRFPDEWTLEAVLLQDAAADSTLQEIDGTWWLFTTIGEPTGLNCDDLHIFYANSPFGPWQSHALNPVKSDVRSARSAGRLFKRGPVWYRPAQDCSQRYGYGIRIHRIVQLDPRRYEESEVAAILPLWYPGLVATHTLNSCTGLTVIDGKRRMPRFWPNGDAKIRPGS